MISLHFLVCNWCQQIFDPCCILFLVYIPNSIKVWSIEIPLEPFKSKHFKNISYGFFIIQVLVTVLIKILQQSGVGKFKRLTHGRCHYNSTCGCQVQQISCVTEKLVYCISHFFFYSIIFRDSKISWAFLNVYLLHKWFNKGILRIFSIRIKNFFIIVSRKFFSNNDVHRKWRWALSLSDIWLLNFTYCCFHFHFLVLLFI